MIFYVSDLHLWHANIIRYSNRPFDSVEEMHKAIISNWNSVVGKNDTVYILGDIGFRNANMWGTVLNRLNGEKHLIKGNHDNVNINKVDLSKYFKSVQDYLEINDKGRKVVLFHYPILEWNGYFNGSYHIYGHIHNNENRTKEVLRTIDRAYNAGIDVNDYFPKTLDQLIALNSK